tara:strand:+ start:3331 stop:3999 length:669 start_codon:yes stop_codon:yes gene_type:complete
MSDAKKRTTKVDKPVEQKTLMGKVASVIVRLGVLGKESRNAFDKYDYASIDKFLEHVREVIGEAGLVVLQDEISVEHFDRQSGGKVKPWQTYVYEFSIVDESGESTKPLRRTVSVPFNGAQASGSAQSYALKQFLRSTFLIATGDKVELNDADAMATDTSPVVKKTITLEQQKIIESAMSWMSEEEKSSELKKWNVASVSDLSVRRFEGCMKYLAKMNPQEV